VVKEAGKMEDLDRERIMANLPSLVEKTRWNTYLEEKLLSQGVFSDRMMQDIKRESNQRSRTETMFRKACKRGPRAYTRLVLCLVESQNNEAARILDPNLQPIAKSHGSNGKVWNPPSYATNTTTTNMPPLSATTKDTNMNSEEERKAHCQLLRQHCIEESRPDSAAPIVTPSAVPSGAPFVTSGGFQRAGKPTSSDLPFVVKVRKAKQWVESQRFTACYPMTRNPRGLCLIVNNEVFDAHKERRGSTVDANNLDVLFGELGFDNVVALNRSAIELKRDIMAFAQSDKHRRGQMAVVVVLSHGERGCVYGTDGGRCQIDWILEQFNNDKCPALIGKPKFFIFQACRGHEEDKGVICRLVPQMYANSYHQQPKQQTETDAAGFTPFRKPTWKDMLIGYATVPGYVANRDVNKGSWYIEAICKVFMNNAADKDIREMMDQVSQEMDEYQSEGPEASKQSSTYEVRGFSKKLYFNPGLYEQKQQQPLLDEKAAATAATEEQVQSKLKGLAFEESRKGQTAFQSPPTSQFIS